MPPSPSLTTLPAELIIHITTFLTLQHTLNLRQVHSSLTKICDFPLQDRRHRLYLHPTSIASAINLLSGAADPNPGRQWTNDIDELILLGSSDAEMRTRSRDNEMGRRLDFRGWDYRPPKTDGSSSGEEEDEEVGGPLSFADTYAALLDGLRKLPNLRVLRYAGSTRASGLGFCGVTDATIWRHAKGRDSWQMNFGGEGQPKLRQALKTVWWGDAEGFATILGAVGDIVERVEILQPMPAVDGFWVERVSPLTGLVGSTVRSVRAAGIGQKGWQDYLTGLFGAMRGIETWEIDITPQFEEERMKRGRNLPSAGESILWEEDESYKRRGHGLTALSSPIRSFILRCHSRPYPYGLRRINLQEFLARHKASLKVVELHNVLLFDVDMDDLAPFTPEYYVDLGIERTAEFMTNELELERSVMTVPRLSCLPECRELQHDDGCRIYPIENEYQLVDFLEECAVYHGIEAGDDGYWDFAELVGRRHISRTA